MRDFEDFCRSSARLARAADVPDYTWFWWKLRPHPRMGTVEIRALDAQSSLDDLVVARRARPLPRPATRRRPTRLPEPPDEILEEGIFRAARWGVAARLPDADGRLRPLPEVLEETLELVAGAASRARLRRTSSRACARLVEAGGGAGRQRAAHAIGGMRTLLRETAATTAERRRRHRIHRGAVGASIRRESACHDHVHEVEGRVPPSPGGGSGGTIGPASGPGANRHASWRSAAREPVSSPRRPNAGQGDTRPDARPCRSRPRRRPELWRRSLARSQRRRAAAAAARPGAAQGHELSAALVAATLVAPAAQVAQAQTPTATAADHAPLLKKGSRGPAVAAAQQALGIPADGVFGPQTRRAVKAFQRAHGLVPDGVIGPLTARRARARPAARPAARARTAAVLDAAEPTTLAVQQKLGHPRRRRLRPADARRRARVPAAAGPRGRRRGRPADARRARALRRRADPAASPPVAASSGASAAVAAAQSKLGAPYASRRHRARRLRLLRPHPVGDGARRASRCRARATTSSASARRSTAPPSRPATSCSSTRTAAARRTSGIATSAGQRRSPPRRTACASTRSATATGARTTWARGAWRDHRARPAVGGEVRIGGDDRHALDTGLRDQDAIERVPVVWGQRMQLPGVISAHRQPLEPLGCDRLGQVVRGLELAERALYGDLPHAGGAHQRRGRRIGDRLPRGQGERGVVREPPEQHVGVAEQPAHV